MFAEKDNTIYGGQTMEKLQLKIPLKFLYINIGSKKTDKIIEKKDSQVGHVGCLQEY